MILCDLLFMDFLISFLLFFLLKILKILDSKLSPNYYPMIACFRDSLHIQFLSPKS